jgi:hypothetical protein
MKLLTLDIETTPNLAYVWGIWDQNVGLNQLVDTTELLCFAAKWYGSKEVLYFRGPDMIASAWELLNEADAVIHFNGKRFDIPHLNREFVAAGVRPPSPYRQIDLLTVVKKQFRLPSNKLQYVATWLGLAGKADTGGFELWKKCMAGDEAAWARMKKYNIQDVRLTEKVYDALLPWINGHPSRHLYEDTDAEKCPTCGSGHLRRNGYAYTQTSQFVRYWCQGCGKYFRATSRESGIKITEAL